MSRANNIRVYKGHVWGVLISSGLVNFLLVGECNKCTFSHLNGYNYATHKLKSFKEMDIGFIHPRAPSKDGTGAAYSATQIVEGLEKRGHAVTVYCRSTPMKGTDRPFNVVDLNIGGIPYHTDTQLNKAIQAYEDQLSKHDIIHSYLMRTIPAVGRISTKNHVSSIVTLNAFGGICPKNDLRYLDRKQCSSNGILKCMRCSLQTSSGHGEYSAVYRFLSRLWNLRLVKQSDQIHSSIDAFHALSPHVKSEYMKFGYPSSKIESIPNILDPKFDIPHHSSFEEPYRLLYVGYLRHSKGVDRLIEIMEMVQSQSSKDIELTIIGSGELKDNIENEMKKKNLHNDINLRGRVPNNKLPMIYSTHDIFVYPGRWDEPFGRVFLEAMAAGTPIVSTDVGSVRDIVDGAGIVTTQSVSSIANSVLSILDSKTLREHSTVGKQRIEQYRSSEIIPQFEQLYVEKTRHTHYDG